MEDQDKNASHALEKEENINNVVAGEVENSKERAEEVKKPEERDNVGLRRKRKASSSPQQSDGEVDDNVSMGSHHSSLSSLHSYSTPPPADATASASVASIGHNDEDDDDGERPGYDDIPPVPPAPPSTPASDYKGYSSYAASEQQQDSSVSYGQHQHYDHSQIQQLPQPPLHQRQDFQDMATPLPHNQHNQHPSTKPSPSSTAQYSYPPTHATAPPPTPTEQQQQPPPTEKASGASKPQAAAQKTVPTEEFADWAVGDRYELIRILGRGSYGEVAQARDLYASSNTSTASSSPAATTFVAIKRITSAFDQEVDAIRLYREIHILRRLKGHDCIIQLLDVIQPPPKKTRGKYDGDERTAVHKHDEIFRKKKIKERQSQSQQSDNEIGGADEITPAGKTDEVEALQFQDLYLVFEYVDTDLYKLIMSPQYLTTEHIQTFLYQMLTGIKYIHSSSVIHRDLKPANILLNEDCSLKICDFGLARIVNRSNMHSSAKNGTANNADDSSSASSYKSSNSTNSSGGPNKPGLTRQLTKHVVTRWYRAPELILIQPYTSAVDIWSLGCILAELLSMQEGSVPGYQDRVPLFPGGSCYPLSGEGASVKSDERLDQLSVIFSVIGTPSAEDVESIGKANEYINTLEKKPGRSLEDMYPAADPSAIDLLKKMLHFNPRKRCTAEEALEHDFLRGVRRKEMERSADQPLIGPDFLEKTHIDMDMLKRRTYEEVLWYRNQDGDGTTSSSLAATTSATSALDAKSEQDGYKDS